MWGGRTSASPRRHTISSNTVDMKYLRHNGIERGRYGSDFKVNVKEPRRVPPAGAGAATTGTPGPRRRPDRPPHARCRGRNRGRSSVGSPGGSPHRRASGLPPGPPGSGGGGFEYGGGGTKNPRGVRMGGPQGVKQRFSPRM